MPPLVDPRDRALVEAICFAVLRQPMRFEAALAAFLSRPLPKRDAKVRALLLVGFAQLDPLGLPAHAAVAATVEAARMLGHEHQAGLVNALLRRAQREGLPPGDPHAHWPAWLRAQLQQRLGRRGRRDPRRQRASRRRCGCASTHAAAAATTTPRACRPAASSAVVDPALPDALRLDTPVPVALLPDFDAGAVSVQDASAQRVADALALAPGARVLDACAAPGGKAAHLLERDPELQLVAVEIDAARLRRMRTGFARLGLAGRGRLLAADATRAVDVVGRRAVRCGAAGRAMFGDRHRAAAARCAAAPARVGSRGLTAMQANLLDALWRTLAPGGVLLYATCSILKAENDAQVAAFLARTADAALEPLDARFGRAVSVDGKVVGHQRLPGEDDGDGFFYARLRKR